MGHMAGWSPLARSLIDRAHALTRDEFVAAFPERVLLAPVVDKKDRSRATTRLRLEDGALARTPPPLDALPWDIVPLRKTSPHGNLITVGRASENDIVLPLAEVSKIHAFFMLDAMTGQVSLTDAGSTNGTKVQGRALAPKVDAALLDGGEEIRVGTVKVVYHEPGTLWNFLRTIKA